MNPTRYRRPRGFLLRFAGHRGIGRWFSRMAALGTDPYHCRDFLARLSPRGFVDADAALAHPRIHFGKHAYVGKNVTAFSDAGGGDITIGDHVLLYGDCFLRTGEKADIRLGERTHIQLGCIFVACLSSIVIGKQVEIASGCSFYSFTHGIAPDQPIMRQARESKGPIHVGDGAWLGHGVTVLQGVSIGPGAVVGAGSVVTKDIPENAIAVGVPARVVAFRDDASSS